ncbi:hypothetical protein CWB99_19590 [Pseudoalteromonas rubra]|uniref:Uncharacterized protein n=1 Tax=Pseudoalteromonas rubra TaxID=43658 RepID=A0A5S3WI01_9GAMM|nr:hypothetical protein [Pseudoalteromonas rubra]TMP26124.1 hypothetical protein CWB99_19590 [Pseudoalteromonas rubra]TMP27466.1 hypothetical protein CWC00_23270 [Pseudoalteromonas rubra]
MSSILKFCLILRKRSAEHTEAISRVEGLHGMVISILRQELDSMIRAIYLLNVSEPNELERLVEQTLNGEVWTVKTAKGKMAKVTDRDMVELSDELNGWTRSVYKFGCSFVHFSNYHDYSSQNPFDQLSPDERSSILDHMRHYHGGPVGDSPGFSELASYFPRVFKKVSENLDWYIREWPC